MAAILTFELEHPMTTAIKEISFFVAVALRQKPALEVLPVFSQVAPSYCRISLLVLVNPNSEEPRIVTWVIFSIQMVV